MELICIKGLETKHINFREGEEYVGAMINDNWYVVEAVGIRAEDFHVHFAERKTITEEKRDDNKGEAPQG